MEENPGNIPLWIWGNSQAHLLADGTTSPPPPPFQSPLEWVADPLTNTPILTLKVEGETIRYQLEDPPPHLQHPNPKGELHSICGEQGQGQEIMDSSLLLGHKEDLEAKFQQSPPHGLGSSQSQLIEVEAQEQTRECHLMTHVLNVEPEKMMSTGH